MQLISIIQLIFSLYYKNQIWAYLFSSLVLSCSILYVYIVLILSTRTWRSLTNHKSIVFGIILIIQYMSRGTNLFVAFSISGIVWIVTLFLSTGYVNEVAKSMPTYALILYFSYALFKVGGDLARLKDYPEEAQSLQKEVEEAKRFYKEKGLKL